MPFYNDFIYSRTYVKMTPHIIIYRVCSARIIYAARIWNWIWLPHWLFCLMMIEKKLMQLIQHSFGRIPLKWVRKYDTVYLGEKLFITLVSIKSKFKIMVCHHSVNVLELFILEHLINSMSATFWIALCTCLLLQEYSQS